MFGFHSAQALVALNWRHHVNFKRLRWYSIVGVALLFVAMVFLGLPIICFVIEVYWTGSAIPFVKIGIGLAAASFGIFVLGLSWISWACPWFESGDTNRYWSYAPRLQAWRAKSSIWLAGVFMACIGAGCLIDAFVFYRRTGSWDWRFSGLAGPILVLVSIILCPPCWWLYRVVSRRYHQTVGRMKICFQCGYDLRGTPGAECPECGHLRSELPG